MPRRTKGPRLWLQPARPGRDGRAGEPAVWVIRDAGGFKRSTRCGPADLEAAEEALAAYIHSKRDVRHVRGHPGLIPIADVVSLYAQDVAVKHARPDETAARLGRLLDFFGGRTLADLDDRLCAAYAAARGAAAARRELEDLRAAIRYHWKRRLCDVLVPVTLPDRGGSRERWLTRAEVARLVWAAWRYREKQNFRGTDRRTRRHVARFMLVALYTGTRAGAICRASFHREPGCGFLDVDHGVFYRRPEGERETKKRKTTIRVPPRLLAHLRRWKRRGQRFVVEWQGRPVDRVSKAFRSIRADAGLGPDVVPHVFRHTCATWAAMGGAARWSRSRFLGMTEETFARTYGHHDPSQDADVHAALTGRPTVSRQISKNETRSGRTRTEAE